MPSNAAVHITEEHKVVQSKAATGAAEFASCEPQYPLSLTVKAIPRHDLLLTDSRQSHGIMIYGREQHSMHDETVIQSAA
jgi:hypothetical protein